MINVIKLLRRIISRTWYIDSFLKHFDFFQVSKSETEVNYESLTSRLQPVVVLKALIWVSLSSSKPQNSFSTILNKRLVTDDDLQKHMLLFIVLKVIAGRREDLSRKALFIFPVSCHKSPNETNYLGVKRFCFVEVIYRYSFLFLFFLLIINWFQHTDIHLRSFRKKHDLK